MNNLATKTKTVFSNLLLISVVTSSSTVLAHRDCTPYTAQFHLEGITPFGPLNGGGIYNIGDQPPQPAQITAVLKKSAKFDPSSPVSEISFSDMVIFPPGVDGSLNILTAVDKSIATAIGPGVFEGKTKSRITGGVGLYEGVSGKAKSTNITNIDLLTGYTVSDITVSGKICGIGEANND